MKILIIINDAPYGTEKAYNALRLGLQIMKDYSKLELRIFLLADSVSCAIPNQITPQGYYNIERMMKGIITRGGKVKACGTCLDARGLGSAQLIEGVEKSNLAEFTTWSVESDKVITF